MQPIGASVRSSQSRMTGTGPGRAPCPRVRPAAARLHALHGVRRQFVGAVRMTAFFSFRPAASYTERHGLFVSVAGGTNSGKTFSAMRVAHSIAGPKGRIAAIDTEGGRIHAGDIGPFDEVDRRAKMQGGEEPLEGHGCQRICLAVILPARRSTQYGDVLRRAARCTAAGPSAARSTGTPWRAGRIPRSALPARRRARPAAALRGRINGATKVHSPSVRSVG